MTVKKTTEGLIFHTDGEVEKDVLFHFLNAERPNSDMGILRTLRERAKEGGGEAFPLFRNEIGELTNVLEKVVAEKQDISAKQGGGEGPEPYTTKTLIKQIIALCRG
jgi:hypothetical protein